MANANTVITLEQLHDAIRDAIRTQFPFLRTVDYCVEERCGLQFPACLFEMEEFRQAQNEDPGTGQLAGYARFNAKFVIGFKNSANAKPKFEIRRLALAFAAFARLNRWRLPVGPAISIMASPDGFTPDTEQHICWNVEWEQLIHLGDTVWRDEGDPPSDVFVGVAPNIGAEHEVDYIQLWEGAH